MEESKTGTETVPKGTTKSIKRPSRPPTPDIQKKIDEIRKEEITKINKVLTSRSSSFTRSSKK